MCFDRPFFLFQESTSNDLELTVVVVFDYLADTLSVDANKEVIEFVADWARSKGMGPETLVCSYKGTQILEGVCFRELSFESSGVLMVATISEVNEVDKQHVRKQEQQQKQHTNPRRRPIRGTNANVEEEIIYTAPKWTSAYGRPVFSPPRYSSWLKQKNFWDFDKKQ